MKVKIHRGGNEIGGNCVELNADGASILLDLGEPLMGDTSGKAALPDIAGLTDGTDQNLLGVIISHPHMDHYGLLPFISPKLPVYIGHEAAKLLTAANAFMRDAVNLDHAIHYRDRQPFQVGPFRITPFIADHSAFDSYSLLIEAGGRRLFYSGDLRGHGWKGWAFDRLLKNPPENIDAMLLEGTTLSRDDKGKAMPESELVELITAKMKETRGIVLAGFSGQNIDRLVTFYKATLKSRRTFVADCYIAHLLRSIGRPRLPDPTSDAMRVFLPKLMKSKIVREKRFDVVEPFYPNRIYPKEMLAEKSSLVVTFRSSMARDFEATGLLDGGQLIYSMWPGYLERGKPDLRDWCADNDVGFDILHTSGHASRDDLKRVVEAIAPGIVLPIHTLAPDRYADLGAPVSFAANNQWYEIGQA